ncbi:uncharacterized protein LOC126833673 isoform X2 [Adelges cooleyi]|uniref:uncharacterized protein LOC126833673 isoform X2 n=1 Tax=Adelges cooleyi TaxID=133065 RepID=UPI00217FF768|nr:uncharacterized protein LOC126833673 isoform X2 [Adelges cooleyi]
MLDWIKQKKRLLLNEFHTNHHHQPINNTQLTTNAETLNISPLEENCKNHAGLPNSFYNSALKTLEEYVRNKKYKESKSNNNNTWINIELMSYICNLLKMSPKEIENLPVSSTTNSSVHLEQSILEMSKANLEYHNDILNYISKCLDSNMSDINPDRAFSKPQYIGLLEQLNKLADYYAEKAQEMRNICLESPRVKINASDIDAVEQSSDKKHGDRKSSCSLSSELSADGAYVLDHLNTLLENRGLIQADNEWPMFGNDDEDDSRSLTDQLLDVKPRINKKDGPNLNDVNSNEKGF